MLEQVRMQVHHPAIYDFGQPMLSAKSVSRWLMNFKFLLVSLNFERFLYIMTRELKNVHC